MIVLDYNAKWAFAQSDDFSHLDDETTQSIWLVQNTLGKKRKTGNQNTSSSCWPKS